jgi:hypothetical protein
MMTVDTAAKEQFLKLYLGAAERRENAELIWSALLRGDQLVYHRAGGHCAHYQLRSR